MTVRPAVQALAPYHFQARPHKVKLDQNESPHDLPSELKAQAVERLLALPWNRYPEMQAESLKEALARHHGWDAAGIVLSAGSNVLIQALVNLSGLGATVLTVSPTFAVFSQQARLLEADLVEVPLGADFSLPFDSLRGRLAAGGGVFFLANPAAPTGNLFSEDQLIGLIQAAGERWTVVLDEAYHQFSGSDFSHLISRHPQVVSLRTCSKAFGLGGVRLGYALARPELARELQKTLLPFSVSSLQLAVGLTVLEHVGYIDERISETVRERERVRLALDGLHGVRVYPSHTNFLLFRVADAEAFYAALLEQGVLIRRQDHLPGLAGCLRVTIGTAEENDSFLEAAARVAERLEAEVKGG